MRTKTGGQLGREPGVREPGVTFAHQAGRQCLILSEEFFLSEFQLHRLNNVT